MAKAILISGEAGCGKGELTNYIKKYDFLLNTDVIDAQCKEHLHTLTMQLFNVEPELYWLIYNDREQKETPNSLFRIKTGWHKVYELITHLDIKDDEILDKACAVGYIDLSLRQAMIYVSECMCKPAFGVNYFGEVRAQKVDPLSDALYVDDSASAFLVDGEVRFDEVEPLKQRIGSENIMLIRVTRPNNPNRVGDSRKPIPDQDDIYTTDLVNEEGKLEYFCKEALLEIIKWKGER